jgi:hypothetical protein
MNSILASNLTVACLVARADLTHAVVELCEAYRGVLREHCEATDRGAAMDLAAREQLVEGHCTAEFRVFIAAWRQGSSAVENMRVIEVAVRGYSERFEPDDGVMAAAERLFLDFMRKAVRRLPTPAQRRAGGRRADIEAVGVAMIYLAACRG